MSSDPKRTDDLIPFDEVTVEKTVSGAEKPTPHDPEAAQRAAEKTYTGTELPLQPVAPMEPAQDAPSAPKEVNDLGSVLDLLTPSQPSATNFPPMTPEPPEAQAEPPARRELDPGPPMDEPDGDPIPEIQINDTSSSLSYHIGSPGESLANDDLTGEIRLPQKPKKDWRALVASTWEMARVRAKDAGIIAREKTGDLVMKFQLLPPKQKKIAYAGASVFVGVFTLALFLPRHRPAPTARQPRPHQRPPRPDYQQPPIRQAQEAPAPRAPQPPVDVAPRPAPRAEVVRKAPVKTRAKTAAKKAAPKKKTAAKKATGKKTRTAQKSTKAKKKTASRKTAGAKKTARKGKTSKQAAARKTTKGRKPASKK